MRLPSFYYELEKNPRLLGTLVVLFSIPLTLLLVSVVQEIRKRAEVSAGNATVSFLPSTVHTSPDSTFSVSTDVISSGGQIMAFAISLRFDNTILEMTDISIGNLLSDTGCSSLMPIRPLNWTSDKDLAAINSQGGFDEYGAVAYGDGCNYRSTGTILNMAFKALVAGNSDLTIPAISLSDPDARGYNATINNGTVNVASPNRPPDFTSAPPETAVVGQPYIYNVEASDPDDDSLIFTLRDFTPGMRLSSTGANTAQMTWTPAAVDGELTHSVAITIDDGHGHIIAQPFRIRVSATPPPQASTVYVDDQGSDYDGCGRTQGDPCATIQRGVDEVAEVGTVHVADGVYQTGFSASDPVRPTVLITKRGVGLLGNVNNPSLVQVKRGSANFTGQPPLNQWFVITIDGTQDVLVRGLSVQGFDGVAVTGNSRAELKHNFIIAQNVGVYNHQTSQTEIINNTIYGSNFGIEAWDQSRVGVYQNDIHLGSSGRMCIAKHDQASVTASGNNMGCDVTTFVAAELAPPQEGKASFATTALASSPNTNYDPMFVDPQNGNLCLNPLSPLIDLGVTDVDGDGADDITDYSGDAPDVGACEYQFCQALNGQNLLWDLNGDRSVTLMDLVLMVQAWRDRENYNPRLDFDSDGDVDIFDIVRVANHWAESCAE